jgi:hypothetical protein
MCLPFRNLWSLFWNDHAPESVERVQANGKNLA